MDHAFLMRVREGLRNLNRPADCLGLRNTLAQFISEIFVRR